MGRVRRVRLVGVEHRRRRRPPAAGPVGLVRDRRARHDDPPSPRARLPGRRPGARSVDLRGRQRRRVHVQPPQGFTAIGRSRSPVDRATRKTQVVSRNTKGAPADRSREPSVGDRRFVSFTSENGAMAAGDETNADIFRYDRRRNQTILVSVGFNGGPTSATNGASSISADGNLVAFVSDGGDAIVNANTGPATRSTCATCGPAARRRSASPATGRRTARPARRRSPPLATPSPSSRRPRTWSRAIATRPPTCSAEIARPAPRCSCR